MPDVSRHCWKFPWAWAKVPSIATTRKGFPLRAALISSQGPLNPKFYILGTALCIQSRVSQSEAEWELVYFFGQVEVSGRGVGCGERWGASQLERTLRVMVKSVRSRDKMRWVQILILAFTCYMTRGKWLAHSVAHCLRLHHVISMCLVEWLWRLNNMWS